MENFLTEELAEIAGMIIADGCVQKDYICMWGNIYEDSEYYNGRVRQLFLTVFGANLKIHEKQSNSVIGFYLCKRQIVNLFSTLLDMPPGSKTYSARVPEIIRTSNSKEMKAAFIRGFSDCDGSLTFDRRVGKYVQFKKKFHTYPRIFLISASKALVDDLYRMLHDLDIPCQINKKRKGKKNLCTPYHIVIRGRYRLRLWMDKIGFNNPSKLAKLQVWIRYGFCPPGTTLGQRKALLKGELNPFSFYKENGPAEIRTRDLVSEHRNT